MDSETLIFARTSTPEKKNQTNDCEDYQEEQYPKFKKHLEGTLLMFRFDNLNTSNPRLICGDVKINFKNDNDSQT